ncbi:MAG: pilus assembly protein TadG-related protein [Acidimicrobiia bacterium]
MTRARDERGQVTAMVAILSVALLALGALVFDGGQIFTARREANNLARQAARAGAQQLDVAQARAGTFTLDPAAADTAVRDYLGDQGITPTSLRITGDRVEVTVTLTQPTRLLALLGIEERTVTATASARAARGVTGEGT